MSCKASSLRLVPSHGLDLSYLQLHYQPQVCLRTGAFLCAEVLARYDDPQCGRIHTGELLDVANASHTLDALTDVIVARAFRDSAGWRRVDVPVPLRVALNVSARQLVSGFPSRLAAALEAWALPSTAVEVEVSEAELTGLDTAILSTLADLGVRLVLEACGSLAESPCPDLPFHAVKIDKMLVEPIGEETDAGEPVADAIRLIHQRGLEVIAEGVETLDQLEFLQHHHCDRIQGYLISRPLPPDALFRLIRRRAVESAGLPA